LRRIRQYGLFAKGSCADNIAQRVSCSPLQSLKASLLVPLSIPASRVVHAVAAA
jgi:hypothetical protein